MKTIIKSGKVISMQVGKEIIKEEDIVFEDDKIIYIGSNYEGKVDKEIDAKNKIVIPGLINCHTHLGMSIFRATNDNYSLDKWLNEFIWPIENNMTDEDIYYTTLLSCVEMIKTGTTCFNDMYFNPRGSFRAFDKSKIRGVYGRCLMGDLDKDGIDRINEFKALYEENDNKLIKMAVAPHALYTTTKSYLEECNKLSLNYDLPIHIHLSEDTREVENVTKKFGKLPMEVLKEVGFLDRKLILAHGTYISDEELDLIKDKDVSICTNPISNLNLGCGIAPITKYLKRNINVCLGTDGVGSGNNMNLFYHMSMLDNLQKGINEDSTIMNSYEVLKIATINGAKALGMENEIGSLEVGKKADIVIVDLDDITMYPTVNPIVQLTHNGWYNSVDTTIINGEVLLENKKLTLDINLEELKKKITEIRGRLL
ncbi:MAG: amidohydrolase [Bacilli bacterium]|nr:amidohydrolase [Bacilli bacterium]